MRSLHLLLGLGLMLGLLGLLGVRREPLVLVLVPWLLQRSRSRRGLLQQQLEWRQRRSKADAGADSDANGDTWAWAWASCGCLLIRATEARQARVPHSSSRTAYVRLWFARHLLHCTCLGPWGAGPADRLQPRVGSDSRRSPQSVQRGLKLACVHGRSRRDVMPQTKHRARAALIKFAPPLPGAVPWAVPWSPSTASGLGIGNGGRATAYASRLPSGNFFGRSTERFSVFFGARRCALPSQLLKPR